MSEPINHGSEPPREQGPPPHGNPPPYGAPPPHQGQPPYGSSQPPYGQPPYPPPPPYPAAHPPLSPSDERMWAIVAHIGPLVLTVLTAGTLFFLVPLVIWLVYRDRSAYVSHQAKESLNFQLTLLLAYVIGFVTIFVLVGFLILAVAFVLAIVFGIQAALAASRHEAYRYPMSIRFIS